MLPPVSVGGILYKNSVRIIPFLLMARKFFKSRSLPESVFSSIHGEKSRKS
ncbi:hypothetical protein HMPREF9996_00937 [Aggregatibacter actinomycetemcomitans Y4]|nr:hypothetical protein HMPREF9996_00937 [Aggregatibacter actinomycetemcomitans Y4]